MLTYDAESMNTAYGQMLVRVNDYRTIETLLPRIDAYSNDAFPDALVRARRFALGPGGGPKIQARFRGPDPLVLRQLTEQAKTIMREHPNTQQVIDDWRQPAKVLQVHYESEAARRAGVSRQDLAQSLALGLRGQTIGLYRERHRMIPVVLRLNAPDRMGIGAVENALVWSSATGAVLPYRQVVGRTELGFEDNIIRREDRRRTIHAQCDPISGPASALWEELRAPIEAIPLPPGYTFEWGGEYEDSLEANEAVFAAVPICAVIMVLAVIVLFNAVRQPLIIFLTVPLAVIGVTAGLLATGQPFGFMATLGFLSLSGMLIKNAIVLIDQIDAGIRAGKERQAAVIDAALSRSRPVLMASLTTVLGMTPLIFDDFFAAMAVTIMAGLTFATVLTLVFVPILYALFFRIRFEGRAA